MKELIYKIAGERESKRWENIPDRMKVLFLEKKTVIELQTT